jgi:hypothetical protein
VVHQRAARLIHLAAFLVFHLKRLPGGDDDGGRGVERGAGEALGLVEIDHRHRPGLAQRHVVRMPPVAQRAQGLFANRLARHQPQDHAVLGTQQVGVHLRHALRRQPGLAAAGRHAQAEIGHVRRKAGQRVVWIAAPPQPLGGGGEGERRRQQLVTGAKVGLDAVQHLLLVLLGGKGGHGVSG